MRNRTRHGWIWSTAILVALGVGCGKDASRNRPEKPELPFPAQEKQPQVVAPGKKAPPKPEPLRMPDVRLPEALLSTCLVKHGDAMPDAELPDAAGKSQSLKSLRGEKLTLVLFWSTENPYSVQALENVAKSLGPYAKRGVRVIGINERDKPDDVRKAAEEAKAEFPNLLDADGAYFARVAKEKLPRVYLLDAGGKILWLDLEYSETTQRQLLEAVKFQLGETS